jgi:Beta-galactosidase
MLAVTAGPAAAAKAAEPAASHIVSYDKYSLMVDGRRVFLWSGEFHPFRLPSPSLWLDILEKMKANGYNAVSAYFDWGYHSPAPGVYDFSGVRDMGRFLDMAAQVGLYVIARPGPYINAEVDAGGFPDWLTTTPGHARTNDATYLSYTDQWQTAIDAIIASRQLTNGGGSVIAYEIENEYAANLTNGIGADYMAHLYAKARADGITVPIFHNDKGRNGFWIPGSFPGSDSNYLYAFDGYPGGTCSTSGNPGTPGRPPDWGYFGIGGLKGGSTASPNTPGFEAEFGGGWFDPWGDRLFGGAGYTCLTTRLGSAYERQYYLTNVANGIKAQNVYMTFGGTNWGWLPAPVVYTSYDYGAAIDEARQPTAKLPTMKELGYFLQAVPPIDQIDPAAPVAASDIGVKVYHLANATTGTQFYFVRNDSSTTNHSFSLPVTTADGAYTVPQSGSLQLNGVDMKALVADFDIDHQHLVYSTSEIMTHATIDGQDVQLYDGRHGEPGETVLRYSSQPVVQVLQGAATSSWDGTTGDLRLDYSHDGLVEVRISQGGRQPALLLFADDATAATFWRLDTQAGPVIVRGPALLRTAAVVRGIAQLTGDTSGPAPLEVWTSKAGLVAWNGATVPTRRSMAGSMVATQDLAGPSPVDLPALTSWKYSTEAPEAQPGFDDSAWATADKMTSNSRTPVPAGQPVLFADDYGFHHGDVWYRGRYSVAGTAARIRVGYQGGTIGMIQVWLDGRYLGASQLPVPTSGQATTATWATTASFAIPPDLQTAGDHIIAVNALPMTHEEDGGANDAFKNARGLTSVVLVDPNAAPVPASITWKTQGDQGGESIADTVRGPLNNGGLYGERNGWYLPGYPDASWQTVTTPYEDTNPGVAWYRTTFSLAVPSGVDASLGLNISDSPTKQYRAIIFVNGWNMGLYVNDVGPQHTFVLPNGILNPRGENTLAIALITNNAGGGSTGGGLGAVSLVDLGTVAGGAPLSLVASPGYAAP